MSMLKSGIILLLIVIAFTSCNKQNISTVNIRYEVDMYDVDSVAITIYSDYYWNSGVTQTINPLDGQGHSYTLTNRWTAARTSPVENEAYYIKVDYFSFTSATPSIGVFVYRNDTSLIDSFIQTGDTNSIILSGNLP